MHKRPATLIEVLVALSLCVLLFGLLFSFLFQSTRLKEEAGEALWPVVEEYALYQRLSLLLPKISMRDEEAPFYLFTEEDGSLIFTYDNGIDSDRYFSSDVVGKLYLDSQARLMLATWPSPHRFQLSPPPCRLEKLMEGVSELHFSFLEPMRCHERGVDPQALETGHEKPTIPEGWSDSWDVRYGEPPAMIRADLIVDGSPLQFTYELLESNKPIRYYMPKSRK
jgi:hypothetical protein